MDDFAFGYRMADTIAGARHRPDDRGEGQGGGRGRGDGGDRRGDCARGAPRRGRRAYRQGRRSRSRTCASMCRSSASPRSRRCSRPARPRSRSTPARTLVIDGAKVFDGGQTRPVLRWSAVPGASSVAEQLKRCGHRGRSSRPASRADPLESRQARTLVATVDPVDRACRRSGAVRRCHAAARLP